MSLGNCRVILQAKLSVNILPQSIIVPLAEKGGLGHDDDWNFGALGSSHQGSDVLEMVMFPPRSPSTGPKILDGTAR